MNTIIFQKIDTWPSALMAALKKNQQKLCAWEVNRAGGQADFVVSGNEYDLCVKEVADIIKEYNLLGYHCTRLSEDEIKLIQNSGLIPQNLEKLHSRINSLNLDATVAYRLKTENEMDEEYRAEKIWFIFNPPFEIDEDGIGRFFRSWGGEALYNQHEDDDITGPILKSLGSPCVIEASIPIYHLDSIPALAMKIIRRFVLSTGAKTSSDVEHEDCAVAPIPPENILRVACYPSQDFFKLTKADNWQNPL
jgi:hypothetical protein